MIGEGREMSLERPTFRLLQSAALAVAIGFTLAAPVKAQPTWTQEFDLVPGWNAIYLHVQPTVTDPSSVFAGIGILSAWTRGVEPGSIDFVTEPDEPLTGNRGWLGYVPASNPDSVALSLADNELVSVEGNRAYLIRIGDAPATLTISGRPLVPTIDWQANEFTLAGFPTDPANPPTFAEYFGSSPAHDGQPVYRLLPTGVWERVAAPNAATIRYGEAYWVMSSSGSEFIAPLDVEPPTTNGLSYGRGVPDLEILFQNLHGDDVTIEIAVADDASPEQVPLSYFSVVTEPGPNLGDFEWLSFDGTLEVPAEAGMYALTRLAVRRGDFGSSPSVASVISITDGRGTRWLLPVEATRASASAAALSGNGGNVSEFAGLWIGSVTVDKVSQPQSGSMVAVPTDGLSNTCTGGPNEGMSCSEDSDCPGFCSMTCRGGDNAGAACSTETQEDDCPGSSCVGQPRICAAGIDVGLPCNRNRDCTNALCKAKGTCANSPLPGTLCTDDGDCEEFGSTCVLPGSICIGGSNADSPCDSGGDCQFLCNKAGGGSEFPMRLMLHVGADGKVRLLKKVIQMWQNGTTKPNPNRPGFEVVDEPGRFVLLTDDELVPDFQGASLRDGQPVGRRISTVHFDFAGNDLEMTGDFGGANELSAVLSIASDLPTNPYRHPFHPDHDNLSSRGDPAVEAFAFEREVRLTFTEDDPSGLSGPDLGFDEVAGLYSETITGLHRNEIRVEGTFRLQRAAAIADLNPAPEG